MPELYLNDTLYGTLSEQELKFFLEECESNGIEYIRIDDISWQLLPSLLNLTLLIKPLSASCELYNLARSLQAKLYCQGANAILDRTPDNRPELSDILDAQIFMELAETAERSPAHNNINIYYSLKSKKKSKALIGELPKKIGRKAGNMTYRLASYWRHLVNLNYFSILHSQIPTVLIEFNSQAITDTFSDIIINNIYENLLCLYGKTASPADFIKLKECWNKSTQPATAKKHEKLSNENNNKKRRYKKGNFLILPQDKPVNYFIRPNERTIKFSDPPYSSSSNDFVNPQISKSTFNKDIMLTSNSSNQNSLFQKLKQLEQMLNND